MVESVNGSKWFEDYAEESQEGDEDADVINYDLSVTPNDFNVATLFSYIESGTIVIPGFQRHYVWDLKRASRLIESLIRGLPVPQIFLYEEGRNKLLVVDGQQRLKSIYYFIKQRFPRMEARAELRRIFAEQNSIPDDVLSNDKYFTSFRLRLPESLPDQPNELNRLTYNTLGEFKLQLDLRPLRNVVIRENSFASGQTAIYEIFNRLNSGGVNLRPQEIRLSLYHSDFYDMLMEVNADKKWREILNSPEPDLHQKDIEILLRIFAMLIDSGNYSPSMVKFLNQFSHKCKSQNQEKNQYLKELFQSFLDAARGLPKRTFLNDSNNRFNIALIEAVFAAACSKAFAEMRYLSGQLDPKELKVLKADKQFSEASSSATTQTSNVRTRLKLGRKHVTAL